MVRSTALNTRAGTASIMVAVQISVTPVSGSPVTKQSRLLGTLARTSSGWKLSALGQVPVGAASPSSGRGSAAVADKDVKVTEVPPDEDAALVAGATTAAKRPAPLARRRPESPISCNPGSAQPENTATRERAGRGRKSDLVQSEIAEPRRDCPSSRRRPGRPRRPGGRAGGSPPRSGSHGRPGRVRGVGHAARQQPAQRRGRTGQHGAHRRAGHRHGPPGDLRRGQHDLLLQLRRHRGDPAGGAGRAHRPGGAPSTTPCSRW